MEASKLQKCRTTGCVVLRACSNEGPHAESLRVCEGAHQEGGHRRQGKGTAQTPCRGWKHLEDSLLEGLEHRMESWRGS